MAAEHRGDPGCRHWGDSLEQGGLQGSATCTVTRGPSLAGPQTWFNALLLHLEILDTF